MKYGLSGSEVISVILFHKSERAIHRLDKQLEKILVENSENSLVGDLIKEVFHEDNESQSIAKDLGGVLSIMEKQGSLVIGGLGEYYYVKPSIMGVDRRVRERISEDIYCFLHELGRQINV